MKIETNRISENEIHVIDVITGGLWKVIAPHRISETGAMLVIIDVLTKQDIRPAKGAAVTVKTQIRVIEEGEQPHPIFADILAQIEKLKSRSPASKADREDRSQTNA